MEWLRWLVRRPRPAAKLPIADGQALWRFLLDCTDPAEFTRFEPKIRSAFDLHRRVTPYSNGPSKIAQRHDELSLIGTDPKVAAAFLFHGDGVIREAALKALRGPIELPVTAYGLVRRLNDWSPEVRNAATDAVQRCFGTTDEAILMPAVWIVLSQAQSWGRWAGGGSYYVPSARDRQGGAGLQAIGYRAFVETVMAHPRLVAMLVERLCQDRKGGTTQVFWAMSRSAVLDPFLLRIAQEAQQPHLRAAATYGLIAGQLSWPLGRKKRVWVDKSMGEYRLEPEFGTRSLSNLAAPESVLRHAFADRSTMVKREAFDRLIALRQAPELQTLIDDCLTDFADTPIPVLRNRRDYLAKVTAETGGRAES